MTKDYYNKNKDKLLKNMKEYYESNYVSRDEKLDLIRK